jgi:tRNA A-37 threonylcarbamoyl transferase component Bud32
MIDTSICPFCSEEIKASAIKCKHCGSMVGSGTVPPGTTGTGATGTGAGGTNPTWWDLAGPLTEGTLVREYRIERTLGIGGMGEVYLARNSLTGQSVALKVVSPEVMRQPGIRERFVEEARVMSLLRHPGIVQLYSFFEEGNRFFMAMEYIEGRELDDFLDERPLNVDEAVSICGQMLKGLAYAHSLASPIVHRDIKPGNILVTKEGRVVIIDFGVAKALGRDKMTKTGAAVGTYEYMSPEQVQGEEVSPASDVYAAGIVLYKMLSGIVPFPQQSQGGFECMKSQVEKEPPAIGDFREGIPDWLVAIIGKALSKNAANRYQNAGEMAAALGAEEAPAAIGPTAPAPVMSTTVPSVLVPAVTEPGDSAKARNLLPLYAGGAVVALILLVVLGIKLGGSGDGGKKDGLVKKSHSPGPVEVAGLGNYKKEEAQKRVNYHEKAEEAPPERVGNVGYAKKVEEKKEYAPANTEVPQAEEKPAAPEPICQPACSGRDCGDDGCGGLCGVCRSGWTCEYGSCRAPEPVCQPACSGRDCGDDGCGGSCGSCRSGWACEYGSCRAPEPVCQPACSGRDCGDDGCGGSCGSCKSGWTCGYGSCNPPALKRLSVYGAEATDWNYRYNKPARYSPENLLDGSSHTAWCKSDGTGESITLRLSGTRTVRQVRILNGYQKTGSDKYGDRFYRNSRVSKARIQDDSGNGQNAYLPDEKSWQYIEVDSLRTDRIIIRPTEGYWGQDRSLCMSEVEIWGND